MLNKLWLSFFLLAFLSALLQAFGGNWAVFSDIMQSVFAMARSSVDIAIGLIGLMCFWLGLFKVIEQSGLIHYLAKALAPLFAVLMPEVPKNHAAQSAITMNLAANMLGLDNAATPLGIKAMQALQELNPSKQVASNAQILFLVLNTSSVTLLPVTIFMYRAQAGASISTDVFLPILLATSASTLAGLLAVSLVQKLPLYKPVVLAYFAGFAVLMGLLMTSIAGLSHHVLAEVSSTSANVILFSFIVFALLFAHFKAIDVYDGFIEGAKEGFQTAIGLLPYLVAMLVAIAALRASGVLDMAINGLSWCLQQLQLPSDFTAALPTAFMKPFSGSGARAMMLESFEHYGVDSFIGHLTSVMQGSTETTFYVLAVYFGAVGIKHGRHAIACGLFADIIGILSAIIISYWFFA
jgi:spore maturation protein SpmA